MSKISPEPGTDEVGQLLEFVSSSIWLILERNSGLLWKLLFVIILAALWRFFVKTRKPKAVRPHRSSSHAREDDSDSDEEPAPRHLSSRGRSPHRRHVE